MGLDDDGFPIQEPGTAQKPDDRAVTDDAKPWTDNDWNIGLQEVGLSLGHGPQDTMSHHVQEQLPNCGSQNHAEPFQSNTPLGQMLTQQVMTAHEDHAATVHMGLPEDQMAMHSDAELNPMVTQQADHAEHATTTVTPEQMARIAQNKADALLRRQRVLAKAAQPKRSSSTDQLGSIGLGDAPVAAEVSSSSAHA